MKINITARRKAREQILQALYQWFITEADPIEIEAQFLSDVEKEKKDQEYFHQLFHGIINHVDQLDQTFAPLLDRPLIQLNPIEHIILRLSTFELLFKPEIPYRVVINEAIELAKSFGAEGSHKYVNGVLDKIAHIHRSAEIQTPI